MVILTVQSESSLCAGHNIDLYASYTGVLQGMRSYKPTVGPKACVLRWIQALTGQCWSAGAPFSEAGGYVPPLWSHP